jgi:hypothetical protein
MTTDYQAEPGKKLFGAGALIFGHGLIWFHPSWPGGIFTLHPLKLFDATFRAEIVVGAILAAFGILVWRSASHELSLANYVFVASCASVLVLCASEISEWDSLMYHQRGDSFLVLLGVGATKLTMVICIAAIGAWWADSTYMRERFRGFIRSGPLVK